MRDYTEIASFERAGFEVIVDKTWEDLDPRDMFEADEADEICRKIDNYDLDWFMLRVRVLLDGHELGSSYLGGCCYEWNKVADVLTDGTAEDKIEEAMAEAREEALRLKHRLIELDLESMV